VSSADKLEQYHGHYQLKRNPKFDKVLIIGLGQLGLPVAKYVKQQGFDVYGYDVSINAMNRAEKIAGIKKASLKFSGDIGTDAITDFDAYILIVSTHDPLNTSSPNIDGLLTLVNRISKDAKDGALVSIESTIPKGTSKKVFEMLNYRLHVVHAPHRWYALEEKYHGVNQLRVIGGVCDCCLKVGMQFYNDEVATSGPTINRRKRIKSLGIPLHPVPEVEIAEISKIAENAHRYLQIAFAEELYLYCQSNRMDFSELRKALNTKWNVDILEPREGIGGHCLPKDTKMFLDSSKSGRSKMLTAALEVDSNYRMYLQSFRDFGVSSGNM
jgi:nucleotide sugar dehydrogenase